MFHRNYKMYLFPNKGTLHWQVRSSNHGVCLPSQCKENPDTPYGDPKNYISSDQKFWLMECLSVFWFLSISYIPSSIDRSAKLFVQAIVHHRLLQNVSEAIWRLISYTSLRNASAFLQNQKYASFSLAASWFDLVLNFTVIFLAELILCYLLVLLYFRNYFLSPQLLQQPLQFWKSPWFSPKWRCWQTRWSDRNWALTEKRFSGLGNVQKLPKPNPDVSHSDAISRSWQQKQRLCATLASRLGYLIEHFVCLLLDASMS